MFADIYIYVYIFVSLEKQRYSQLFNFEMCVPCQNVCFCFGLWLRPLLIYQKQPEFWKCWDIFKIWIKLKLKDFQITWAYILFTIEHREHNKCLNWEILHFFYPLNDLISNLMPATGLKKVGTGATKGWKCKTFWKDSAGRTSIN